MGVDTCLLRLIIFLALFGCSFFSRAQTPYALLNSVEMGAEEETFDVLIKKISRHYEVNFLYSHDFLPLLKKEVPAFKQHTLQETLYLTFSGTNIEYFISGKNVLLRRRQEQTIERRKPAREVPAPVRAKIRPFIAELSVRKIIFQLSPLSGAGYQEVIFAPVSSPVNPSLAEQGLPAIHPVKLGPAYVQPRRQYGFLDRMGEPVKTLKPNMRLVMTDYSNSPIRETDETLYKYRLVNFSIVPGLGSNGLNPGTFYNGISLNLTVDYSAGNNLIGLAGISNFSKYSAYGLQLAGLVNVVGGDLRQHRYYTRSELLEMRSPFRGVQLAGLGNIVTGDVRGFEGALLFNLVGGTVRGWQVGGLSNLVAERVLGFQSSLLFNYAGFSVNGVQLAAINYTRSDLDGLQAGLFNHSRNMSNPAYASVKGDGMQFGLVNISGAMGGYQLGLANLAGNMNGLQIGLVNSSRDARGCHIGLVNLFSDHKGHAFGLLNIGGSYSARFWASETFPSNIGIVTGTDRIANAIFYSRNFLFPSSQGIWPVQAFGYGLSRGTLFDPRDLLFLEFLDYRFNMSWVNFSGVEKQPFNLLFNPHLVYGRKLHSDWYVTIGGGLNAWWMPEVDDVRLSRLEVASFKRGQYSWKFWPGLTLGIERRD